MARIIKAGSSQAIGTFARPLPAALAEPAGPLEPPLAAEAEAGPEFAALQPIAPSPGPAPEDERLKQSYRAEYARLRLLLEQILDELEAHRARIEQQCAAASARLAVRIAERILRARLAADPGPVQRLVAEALAAVGSERPASLHLNPADLEAIRNIEPDLLSGLPHLHLVEDPRLSRGGCLVETEIGALDARLESQLDRLDAAVQAAIRAAVEEASGADQSP